MAVHFTPLPDVTNTRLAVCRRCKRTLYPGQGRGWKFISRNITNSPVVYLCADCAVNEQGVRDAAEGLRVIGRMLRWAEPLGFVNRMAVERAAREAGEKAPKIAAEIAERIELGETFTVHQVIKAFHREDAKEEFDHEKHEKDERRAEGEE